MMIMFLYDLDDTLFILYVNLPHLVRADQPEFQPLQARVETWPPAKILKPKPLPPLAMRPVWACTLFDRVLEPRTCTLLRAGTPLGQCPPQPGALCRHAFVLYFVVS